MTPTGERCLGGLLGVLLAIGLCFAVSPVINWLHGFGFVWVF